MSNSAVQLDQNQRCWDMFQSTASAGKPFVYLFGRRLPTITLCLHSEHTHTGECSALTNAMQLLIVSVGTLVAGPCFFPLKHICILIYRWTCIHRGTTGCARTHSCTTQNALFYIFIVWCAMRPDLHKGSSSNAKYAFNLGDRHFKQIDAILCCCFRPVCCVDQVPWWTASSTKCVGTLVCRGTNHPIRHTSIQGGPKLVLR